MLPLTNWDVRYALDSSEYDWYVSAHHVAKLVESLTGPEDEILYLGCGTSALGKLLYERNRRYVTNIDASDAVVRVMSKRMASLHEMQYLLLDARSLPDDLTGAVNMVVDKGLLDALLCEVELDSAKRYLGEVKRVLKRGGGGWFCLVSHGQPDSRVPLLMSCFGLVGPNRVGVGLVPKPRLDSFRPTVDADDNGDSSSSSNYFVYTVRMD